MGKSLLSVKAGARIKGRVFESDRSASGWGNVAKLTLWALTHELLYSARLPRNAFHEISRLL
jgi:hypothetical protein